MALLRETYIGMREKAAIAAFLATARLQGKTIRGFRIDKDGRKITITQTVPKF